MGMDILKVFKRFRQENDIPAEQETMVARAIRSGWNAAQDENARHRKVRRSYRGILSRDRYNSELPY
jgi:hypothetical protein